MANDMTKPFFLSTPIYYVNDAPHIGHAYTTTAGDVLTRWHRQRGEDVWFLTGTDEHGTKVQRAAEENGVKPQVWVDDLVAKAWLPVLETLDAANDDFIRTTEERHVRGVQAFWQRLKDSGAIYQDTYIGPYCVGCEEFKLPGDLVDGVGEYQGQMVCAIHAKPCEMLEESNWFFKLSDYAADLLQHYRQHPQAVRPVSAYNEVVSFIEQGLTDISMSRSAVEWGIPLPWQPEQVVYVWFDALLNYVTATGFGAEPGSPEAQQFEKLWPASVHLVGKDILRFHAVYWPAMLLAAGLPLPQLVFAHGWLLVGGEKMSKSKLTGIAPDVIIDYCGSDAFRYYFMSAIRFGSDGSFSWEDLTARYTAELANGLGNLASRLAAMVERYFEGKLPSPGELTEADLAIKEALTALPNSVDAKMCDLDFAGAISQVRSLIEITNGYVTQEEPWVLAKDPTKAARLATVLYVVAEVLRVVAVLYHPVMPKSTVKLWHSIGADVAIGPLPNQRIAPTAKWGVLPAGTKVTKTDVLFPRLAEEE